ncbi:VOC family protein [Thermodesulfobacteriota bacterium]
MVDGGMNSEDSPFSRLAHISVVVKDINKVVKFYESIGIGPFVAPDNHQFSTKIYKGEPLKSELIIREARIGAIVLQLVQHIKGDCVVKDFLDRKGEGVYHLGFLVEDVNKEEEKIGRTGIKVLQKGRRNDESGYAYFDTEEHAGIILEIKQAPRDR